MPTVIIIKFKLGPQSYYDNAWSQDGWAATQETVTPTETPEKLEPAAKRPKCKTYDISLKIAPPGICFLFDIVI